MQPSRSAPSPPVVPCRGSACTSSAWSRRRPASPTPLSGRARVRGNSACIRKQAAAVSSRWRAPRRWHTRRPPASRRRGERVRRRASWSWASWGWWSAESGEGVVVVVVGVVVVVVVGGVVVVVVVVVVGVVVVVVVVVVVDVVVVGLVVVVVG